MADRRVYLVGCGKAKLTHAAPARDLYTGPLFRASLRYAEAAARLDPDPWGEVYILSGWHGLLGLDQWTLPYELALGDCDRAERRGWAEVVVEQMAGKGWDFERTEFVLLAGAAYVTPLTPHLKQWSAPMAGLGQGKRLAWLKANTPRAEVAR
jgi:hypothetical protein